MPAQAKLFILQRLAGYPWADIGTILQKYEDCNLRFSLISSSVWRLEASVTIQV